MKIKFKVYHTYGLAYEEIFTLEELGLGNVPFDEINSSNKQLCDSLINWTTKKYNHGDALPSWEFIN